MSGGCWQVEMRWKRRGHTFPGPGTSWAVHVTRDSGTGAMRQWHAVRRLDDNCSEARVARLVEQTEAACLRDVEAPRSAHARVLTRQRRSCRRRNCWHILTPDDRTPCIVRPAAHAPPVCRAAASCSARHSPDTTRCRPAHTCVDTRSALHCLCLNLALAITCLFASAVCTVITASDKGGCSPRLPCA